MEYNIVIAYKLSKKNTPYLAAYIDMPHPYYIAFGIEELLKMGISLQTIALLDIGDEIPVGIITLRKET